MATEKAPGTLEVVQDFANTVDIEGGTDEIAAPAALRAWLADRGLMDSNASASELDLAQAHGFREALRHVLAANAGEPHTNHAFDALTEAAARGDVGPVFSARGEVMLEASAGGVAGALGRIVAYVVDAIADGTWPRLKACQNDDCQWVFYDSARNRSAKWCSMAVCGNRMKARAFRARQADTEA
jgi:predicted RNA-binding Zn ribbon-like protein